MSADWQIGDLAVCVDDVRCTYYLKRGHVYTVESVRSQYLRLRDIADGFKPNGGGFYADRFRKIRPDEHTECEPEFVQLLERSRKRVSA